MARGGENILFWNILEHSILLNEVCPQGKVFNQSLTCWGFIRASLIWGIKPEQPLVFHVGKVKYHNQGFQWLVVVVVVKVTQSCLTLATPWAVARQALLSMGFPRQEYWSGLPFPSPVQWLVRVQIQRYHPKVTERESLPRLMGFLRLSAELTLYPLLPQRLKAGGKY